MGAWDAAQAQVATRFDPQQAAIQRAIQQTQANTAAGEQSLQGYGQQGREIIGQNYSTLQGLLGQSRQQQAADLGQQANLTDQGYAQAQATIDQGQQGSRDFINQMSASLGQQGAGLRSISDLESLVGQQTGRNSTGRATFGGNLRDWSARMDSISGQGIDSARQGEALRRSEFESQLLALLGGNKLQGQQQENEMTGQLSDILGQRQSSLIEAYNQLAQQEWENSFKQAQLDQQASQASAELSLRAQGMAADNAYRNKPKEPENLTMDILKWMQGDKQQQFENDLATSNYQLDREKLDMSGRSESMDPMQIISFASENGYVREDGTIDINGVMRAISDVSSYMSGAPGAQEPGISRTGPGTSWAGSRPIVGSRTGPSASTNRAISKFYPNPKRPNQVY